MKTLTREQWLYCLQIGLSMMLAYFVTHGRDPINGIYAVMGAGLVTAPSVGEGIGISRDRIIGTLLGAFVSLAAMWLDNPLLALGMLAVVVAPLGMMLGGIAVTRVAITVMAVTVVLHSGTADIYGFYRFTNTVAGVAVALVVSVMLWPLAGRLNFSSTICAVLRSSAKLAEQLAACDPKEIPLEAQKKVIVALSALPKSLTNMRLDPLLYRERARLQQEAQIVVKISVALLSTSLALARADLTVRHEVLTPIGDFYRYLAGRLRWVQSIFPKGAAVAPAEAATRPPLALAGAATMPVHFLLIIDELLVIDRWLDELQSLLLQDARRRT
jgi:uncharacterized membrane protein YccC